MIKGSPPLPISQFFQIHGCKLKLHPIRNLGQASVVRITHRVFFFCICKDPFDRLFAACIQLLVFWCIPRILSQFHVVLPDMSRHRFFKALGIRTKMPGWTFLADVASALVFPITFPVRGRVVQRLVLRANDDIIVLVIDILPPFMPAFFRLRPLVSGGKNSAIIKNFLADMRCLVRAVRYHGFHLGKSLSQPVVYIVECHAVMYISCRYDCLQDKSVLVTGSMGLISEAPFMFSLMKQAAIRIRGRTGNFSFLRSFLPSSQLFL